MQNARTIHQGVDIFRFPCFRNTANGLRIQNGNATGTKGPDHFSTEQLALKYTSRVPSGTTILFRDLVKGCSSR